MAGQKLFTNTSPYQLNVSLLVRISADPSNQLSDPVEFSLPPNGSGWQSYGDNINIYLNGINLLAVTNGSIVSSGYFVIKRASDLDNELNQHNAVNFTYQDNTYKLTTHQVN
jgi:hypothetical protein